MNSFKDMYRMQKDPLLEKEGTKGWFETKTF
jgi:hypothetical protein